MSRKEIPTKPFLTGSHYSSKPPIPVISRPPELPKAKQSIGTGSTVPITRQIITSTVTTSGARSKYEAINVTAPSRDRNQSHTSNNNTSKYLTRTNDQSTSVSYSSTSGVDEGRGPTKARTPSRHHGTETPTATSTTKYDLKTEEKRPPVIQQQRQQNSSIASTVPGPVGVAQPTAVRQGTSCYNNTAMYDWTTKEVIENGYCSRCSQLYRVNRIHPDNRPVGVRKITFSDWHCHKNDSYSVYMAALRELDQLAKLSKHENVAHFGKIIYKDALKMYVETDFLPVKTSSASSSSSSSSKRQQTNEMSYQGRLSDAKLASFSLVQTLKYMLQMCEGLQFLHLQKPTPIAHRDIRPQNIYLFNNPDHVKLGQPATANFFECSHCSSASMLYSAPEFLLNKVTPNAINRTAEIEETADLWSLGLVFYQLLNNNKLPITGNTPTTILNSIAKEFCVPKKLTNGRLLKLLPMPTDFNKKYPVELVNLILNRLLVITPSDRIRLKDLIRELQLISDKAELFDAVKKRDAPTVDELLASRNGSALLEQKDKFGRTPLLLACETPKNNPVVSSLLQKIDYDELQTDQLKQKNKFGYTPLMTAAFQGRNGAINQLIEAHKQTPPSSISSKTTTSNQQPQPGGSSYNHPVTGVGGLTPLMAAVIADRRSTVRQILLGHAVDEFVDVNATTSKSSYYGRGNTALMLAARLGRVEIAKILIEIGGADTTLKNGDGKTAMEVAFDNEQTEIARLLYKTTSLNSNSSVTLNNRRGITHRE